MVRGDLSDPPSPEQPLRDVGAVFLVWPFMASAGADDVLDVMKRHARRVVYLSRHAGALRGDPQTAREEALALGWPPDFVAALFDDNVFEPQRTTTTVDDIIGRPPRSIWNGRATMPTTSTEGVIPQHVGVLKSPAHQPRLPTELARLNRDTASLALRIMDECKYH